MPSRWSDHTPHGRASVSRCRPVPRSSDTCRNVSGGQMNRPAAWVLAAAVLTGASPAYAQLGSRPAEEWIARLDRPERLATLKTAEVTQKLGIKSGDIVADIGAGAGAFSWPFAKAVGTGTVYA